MLSLAVFAAVASSDPYMVTEFPLKNAAVTQIATNFPQSTGPALLVTTFAAFGSTPVYYISNLDKVMNGSAAQVLELERDTAWTNFIDMTPPSVFAGDRAVVTTAGGFLVPTKTTGTIDLFEVSDLSNIQRTKVSTDKSSWFYHKIVWADLNGDGLDDILAARATAPTTGGAKQGQLIWLEHPSDPGRAMSNTTTTPWEERVLVSGPDVDFIFEDINGDGKEEVIATQFFSASQLAVYACPAKLWSECGVDDDQTKVTVQIIDNKSGPFFSLQRVDVNSDGRKDLLVTNNEDDGTGSVFVYEQPENIMSTDAQWTKHTLQSGYRPIPQKIPSPGRGSPGAAQAFHIKADSVGSKPSILVSGDDGGFMAILSPASPADPDNWSYKQFFLCNSTGTMGTPSIGDANSDGIADIWVPYYSDGKIEVYSFIEPPPAPGTPTPAPFVPDTRCEACLLKMDPVGLSPDSTWCAMDQECYLVGSLSNPCKPTQCASAAATSSCKCTSCNDAACHA